MCLRHAARSLGLCFVFSRTTACTFVHAIRNIKRAASGLLISYYACKDCTVCAQARNCCSWPVYLQVNKSTKQAQQRKAKAAPSYADDSNATTEAPKRWSDYTVQFEFPEPTELPPPLIQLNDVSFQYPGRDDFGLKDLNIGLDMGSRVAIVGPNGAGKTTLMNLLSGKLLH